MLRDVRARHVKTPPGATLGPWEQQSVTLKLLRLDDSGIKQDCPLVKASSLQQHSWWMFI